LHSVSVATQAVEHAFTFDASAIFACIASVMCKVALLQFGVGRIVQGSLCRGGLAVLPLRIAILSLTASPKPVDITNDW